MKKITSLLMLFCAFVGMAWAAPTDLPEVSANGTFKYYTISNTRSTSGKYLYYAVVGNTLKDKNTTGVESIFYFEDAGDGKYYICNLATNKKLAGHNSWSDAGVPFTLSETPHESKAGLAIGFSNTYLNEQNQADGFTTWGADDAGSIFVVEAIADDAIVAAFTETKSAVANYINNLTSLPVVFTQASAIKSEVEALTANTVAEASANAKSVCSKYVTAVAEANGKNVKFANQGSDGRNGRFLGYDNANNRAAAIADGGDVAIWTIKANANADGTFKLYNWVNNIYLGTPADPTTPVVTDEASAPSFTFISKAENQVALVAGGKMAHVANHTNYKLIQYYDLNDGASIWNVTVVPEIVVTRDQYNAAAAAKATLPYGIQQAYGLVTDASNYYSNYKSEQEGTYAALLDNTESSFFHSAYGSEAGDGSGVHYIQADLGEGNSVDQFYFYMLPRSGNGNNRPKNITIYGSNDINGEFTKITDVTTTLDASMNPYMSEKIGTQGTNYRYIRFTVTSTNSGTTFFTLSELYILPASVSDVATLVDAYNNFGTTSITSNDFATYANALVNGEATLALSNIKKEVNALLTANATNHAETPALGQYSTAAYNALQAAYNAADATQESLETVIANFNKAKNVPVYFITSKHNGYAAGSAIYYDGAWKWKTANKYDKQMWMTIPDYNQANVPAVDAYNAEGTSYAICDYLTGTKMRGKDVQIVKVADWEGAYNLQYNADANSTDAAQHAKDNGQLVNWTPGTQNDAQASVWGIEYLGSSYELAQLTDDKIAALAGLQTAYNAVADLKNAEIGTGLGEYDGSKDAIVAAVTAAEVIEEKTLAEQAVLDVATIVAATTALNDCADDLTINLPVAGKYYRFQGACEASLPNYYITGHTNADGGRIALTAEADASTIYYFDGTNLIAYQSGLVIGLNNSHWTFASVDDNSKPASTITFTGSPRKAGAYSIKSADRYFHYTVYNNTVQVNRCSEDVDAEHAWYITEVTELPVEITAAGYATFYAPVEVTLPTGVTAHTVTENGEWATLSEAINVVPAENGVILAGAAGTYNLAVSNTGAENLEGALAGTVAKTLVTKTEGDAYYVLGVVEEEVGLYNPVKGEDDTKFYNAGHKAYWYIPAASQTAGFRFGGNTTAIESVVAPAFDANAPIYDLSGRRVNNAVKGGLYIQNGKKFIVR